MATGRLFHSRLFRIGDRLMPLALLVSLTGCETDTARLVQEIDAAREGCTDEMLAAGAEECVQMFERYIDMGTNAMERYIGAMRSLDAALDRRGGVMFDTAGLGHAISPDSNGSYSPAGARWRRVLRESGFPMDAVGSGASLGSDPYETGVADDTPERAEGYDARSAPGSNLGIVPAWDSPSPQAGDPPVEAEQRKPANGEPTPERGDRRRGVLLPPEERLQRPWISGEDAADAYYPDRAAPAGGVDPMPPDSRRAATPYDDVPQ